MVTLASNQIIPYPPTTDKDFSDRKVKKIELDYTGHHVNSLPAVLLQNENGKTLCEYNTTYPRKTWKEVLNTLDKQICHTGLEVPRFNTLA